nr:FUSC family protein [Oleiagrimonas sp. C23AA]
MQQLHEGLAGAGRDWLFVARAAAAMLVAAWLALRFNLENPASTMITVGIVMHPHSGMVLAKSFYRAIGTLCGSFAGLLLVALFAQQHLWLLGSMALWLGACAGGAALYRNFKSYGFVLAGYTAGIVAIPVLSTPTAAFDSAVMRVSEVLLALIVAAVFSDVLLPQRLRDVLRQTVRAQLAGLLGFAADSLSGRLPRGNLEAAHLRAVREVLEIENLRSSVVFESEYGVDRSPHLKRLNQAYMAASGTFLSLHHLMNRLQSPRGEKARTSIKQLFEPLAAQLHASLRHDHAIARARHLQRVLPELRPMLQQRIDGLQSALDARDTRLDFATGAELVLRFADELCTYAAAYVVLVDAQPLPADEDVPSFSRESDHLDALWVMVRTTCVMLGLGAFWIASAWSFGSGAMLIGAIFSALLASAPRPLLGLRQMTLGYTGGIVAAFICRFVVLVHMDGFMLLATGMLPFLLLGFYLYTRPGLTGAGTGFVIAFCYMLGVRESPGFDVAHFLNDAISQWIGIAGTATGFLVLAHASDSRWLRQRLLRRLRSQVVRACCARTPHLRHDVESASRDLFNQVLALSKPRSEEARHLIAWAMSVAETARAVMVLREQRMRGGEAARACLGAMLAALAELYEQPGPSSYWKARRQVTHLIDAQNTPTAWMPSLHLLRLALLEADSVLGRAVQAASMTPGGLSHAA